MDQSNKAGERAIGIQINRHMAIRPWTGPSQAKKEAAFGSDNIQTHHCSTAHHCLWSLKVGGHDV